MWAVWKFKFDRSAIWKLTFWQLAIWNLTFCQSEIWKLTFWRSAMFEVDKSALHMYNSIGPGRLYVIKLWFGLPFREARICHINRGRRARSRQIWIGSRLEILLNKRRKPRGLHSLPGLWPGFDSGFAAFYGATTTTCDSSRRPFLTSPLGANFDPRGKVCPQGWILSPGAGWNSLFDPLFFWTEESVHPWGWTKGWTFP
jgi:hypothetical protein